MTALCLDQIEPLFALSHSAELHLFHNAPSDRVWQVAAASGQGYIQEIGLAAGLSLVIVDCELTQDLCKTVALFRPSLEFEFCLIGCHASTNLTILHLGNSKPLHLPAGQRHLWVEVFVTPPRLESYFYGLLEQFSPRLRQLATDYWQQLGHEWFGDRGVNPPLTPPRLLHPTTQPAPSPDLTQLAEPPDLSEAWLEFEPVLTGKTTSAMQIILNQILNCPYQGKPRQLYLESKALELIVLRFEQIAQLSQSLLPARALSSEDIEKIHQARAILRHQLNQPPSLMALARQVGLNDCTLKRGFRKVFGMTAFECLYHDRMHQAQQLLETGEMTVNQVAAAVGYTSRSSFYTAFRKQFGVGPNQYVMQRRKNSV
ncbi:helix-turn-helix transcriptional regulator [Pantanalinema rosaneae CENA516]|uniref:helix-turn-helix transcriptional regulator n=1 Tax=Pantanalinema rosaneae TaxID=1620701 RepID=UPI003D6EBC00